jgi:hypothetical protein
VPQYADTRIDLKKGGLWNKLAMRKDAVNETIGTFNFTVKGDQNHEIEKYYTMACLLGHDWRYR